MKKRNRLTRSKYFERVKKQGRTVYHPLIVLVFSKNNLSDTRTAVVASKVVSGAVNRNLIKRRLRACIDIFWVEMKSGWDLIFYSRPDIIDADFSELCDAVKFLLKKADVWIE